MPGARPSAVLLLTAAAVVGCGEREAERVPAAPAVPAEHSAPAGPPADEWPGLHGPRFDNSAPADGLTWDWPPGGPPVAWRRPCGTGYAAPVVAGGRVVLLHRVGPDVGPRADAAAALGGDEPREVLKWFDLDTGEPGPSAAVPATFESDYPGHSGAPYATPAVGRRGPDGRRRVYAHGAGGVLRAVDLETAEPLWSRDLAAETRPAAKPFATASSPLVLPPVDSQDGAGGGERVVVATGGAEPNTGLTCLDGATGETVWQSVDAAESYSSPVPVVLRDPETGDPESGRRAILALMKTRLLVADARTGEELGSLPFELRTVDAMNAASPGRRRGDRRRPGRVRRQRAERADRRLHGRPRPPGRFAGGTLAEPPRPGPAIQQPRGGRRVRLRVRLEPEPAAEAALPRRVDRRTGVGLERRPARRRG